MSATEIAPQWSRPGKRRCPGFLRKKVTVCAALTAFPITAPGRAVDAARQIDRNDRRRLRVHAFDHGARQPGNRPVEAGAEQGVDDEVARRLTAAEVFRSCRVDRAGPFLCRQCRVALERGRIAGEQHPHAIAAPGEQSRRHKSVAAIVAGPGDHGDPGAQGMARGNRIGDRGARPLHEIDACDPAGDGQLVGLRHFGIAQKLNHDGSTIAKAAPRG